MSNKLKTLTVYEEFEDVPNTEQEVPDPELLAFMLPAFSKLNALIDEDDQYKSMLRELHDV